MNLTDCVLLPAVVAQEEVLLTRCGMATSLPVKELLLSLGAPASCRHLTASSPPRIPRNAPRIVLIAMRMASDASEMTLTAFKVVQDACGIILIAVEVFRIAVGLILIASKPIFNAYKVILLASNRF